MIEINDKAKCSDCGSCFCACPMKCISKEQDEEGFYYPVVDQTHCIDCGMCEKVCPYLSDKPRVKKYEPTTIAAKAKDEEIRFYSSSGGIFSLFAYNAIEKGGIVVGAKMTGDCEKVEHVIVDNAKDIVELRGSKYIQSDMGNIYNEVKRSVQDGRYVLFSGVSCQIAGLKQFLHKEYSNLLTIEIICHGVPSPMLWEKYKKYWESKHKRNMTKVSFRQKRENTDEYGVEIYSNKKASFTFSKVNPYFIMYNSEMALRPSCYDCCFKRGNSGSDITIGDFWHIEKYDDQFADGKGVSLVLLNTTKGQQLFDSISEEIDYIAEGISFEKAAIYNPGLNCSKQRVKERETFYQDLNKMQMKDFIDLYAPVAPNKKIKYTLMKYGVWQLLSQIRRRASKSS